MNAHTTIKRSAPRLAPLPGNLAAAAVSTARTPVRTFAELAQSAWDHREALERAGIDLLGPGRGPAAETSALRHAKTMSMMALNQLPETETDLLILAAGARLRCEEMESHVQDDERSLYALDGITTALRNIVAALASKADAETLEGLPATLADVVTTDIRENEVQRSELAYSPPDVMAFLAGAGEVPHA